MLCSCKKEGNQNPIGDGLNYDTIYPKAYLPVYPGSYWKYNVQKHDTIVSKTSESYILDFYIDPATGSNSDTFYITELDNIPIWGYMAHTGILFSSSDSYPFTMILNDTVNVGYSWRIFNLEGIEIKREIIAIDTTIQLTTNLAFDSVIIVKEYRLPSIEINEWDKRYYAKNVGLIKEEHYDTSFTIKEIYDYKINKTTHNKAYSK